MTKKSLVLCVVVALAVLVGTVNSSQVGATSGPGQTAKLFVGAGQPGETVFRYEVGMTGTPALELTLTHPTFSLPGFFAFSPAGEMFVSNPFTGTIARFLNPSGTPVFNGTVPSSEIIPNVHWGAFRGNELFLSNSGGGAVVRFTFDAAGNAMFNGEITAGLDTSVRAVQVNPATGELFVAMCCGTSQIRRFLIDAGGNAVPNGSITQGGLASPHDMAFSPWGELFVVNHSQSTVSRFVFDAAGNASPSPHGLISGGSLSKPRSGFQPLG